MKQYDFIAIGGGSAGLAAVGKTAAAGTRSAVVDRGPVGGLCPLRGCNPKKVVFGYPTLASALPYLLA